jgi:hypothetical protein
VNGERPNGERPNGERLTVNVNRNRLLIRRIAITTKI